MPQVPSYGDPSVLPNIPAQERLQPVGDMGGQISAEQLQRAGQAVEGAGEGLGGVAFVLQRRVDEVRLASARNSALEAQQDLTYGQDGLLAQRGEAALNRPSGQALPDEYGARLQQKLSDIGATLPPGRLQREWALESQQQLAQFHGVAEQHMLTEFRSYQGSTWDGQATLAHNQAIKGWNNPDVVSHSLDLTRQAIYQKSKLMGLSGDETQAAMDEAVSGVHRGVIESALENNNPSYAMQYFNQNKDGMTGNDILAVQGQVNHQMDGRVALDTVSATTRDFSSRFMPTEMDRLTGVVQSIESGGRDTNADGTPVTSGKGALYSMQVTPATAKNPGFGITPAKDDSAAEYNRVGQQYLGALVKKYGNIDQALAAYNAGPDAVDKAIGSAKDGNWLGQLPQETQDYVKKGTAAYEAGEGAAPIPTKTEFVQAAVEKLGDNARPEQVSLTREAAEKQYQTLIDSRKEQGEQALDAAHKALIANGGDFASLDPQIKANLARFDSTQYTAAQTFARSISRGENNTDLAAYNAAITYPEELAKMSDTQFEQFVKTNFSTADGERIARLRASYISGKADQSAGSLNSPVFNQVVNNRLNSIGINPTPDRKDNQAQARVGAVKKFIADDIYATQQQLGRKLTPEEVSQHVDALFAKSQELKKTLFGFNVGTRSEPLLQMTVSDIPSGDLKGIRAAFAARGVQNPTEDQIIRTYWTRQNGKR